jgi:glycosyltransferase involved in cell wall biosynthesis
MEDTGCLVPSEDIDAMAEKLMWCKSHPELCKTLGLRARQRVETHYGMDAMVKAYESIFTNVLGRSRLPS